MPAATAADWSKWLRPVAAAVRNPPSQDDFRGRCGALAFALRVDVALLTEDAARELCRKSEFWPSVADIEGIFAEAWKDGARSRSIGGAPLQIAAALPDPFTPEQRQEAVQQARALAADLRGRAGESPRPRPRASFLTGDALATARARVGIGADE